MTDQTIADAKAEARAIIDAAQLRAREVVEIAQSRAFELTQGAAARTRPDPSAAQAHVVAEALLAWRRNPSQRTWGVVFDALRAYEEASKP